MFHVVRKIEKLVQDAATDHEDLVWWAEMELVEVVVQRERDVALMAAEQFETIHIESGRIVAVVHVLYKLHLRVESFDVEMI